MTAKRSKLFFNKKRNYFLNLSIKSLYINGELAAPCVKIQPDKKKRSGIGQSWLLV